MAATNKSDFTPAYAARLNALKTGHYTKIEAAAKAVGVERANDDQPWADIVADVVKAEFKKAGKEIYKEGRSPAAIAATRSAGQYSTTVDKVEYQRWAGRAEVGSDGDKVRTDLNGMPLNF